jgi:hypothetical protein
MEEIMTDLTSFRSIIELWGPKDAHGARLALASEIGASAGMVTKWWQRDSIPAEWWASLLVTPRAIEAGLTADVLTALAARESAEVRA